MVNVFNGLPKDEFFSDFHLKFKCKQKNSKTSYFHIKVTNKGQTVLHFLIKFNMLTVHVYCCSIFCYRLTLFVVFSFRNNLVTDMQEIDRCKQSVQDVEVPLEIFQYVF